MPDSDNEQRSGGTSWMVTRREVMVSLVGLSIVVLTLILGRVSTSSVVLITPNNETVPFPDVEASFGRKIPTSGILGLLYVASPRYACSAVKSFNATGSALPGFLLIERGDCDFVTKVQFAQDAGYTAVVVYNNEMSFDLVTKNGLKSTDKLQKILSVGMHKEPINGLGRRKENELWNMLTGFCASRLHDG